MIKEYFYKPKKHSDCMGRNTIELDDNLQGWLDGLKQSKLVKTKSEIVRECMRRCRNDIDTEMGRK